VSQDTINSDIAQLLPGVFESGKTYRASAWCLADAGERCRLFFGDSNLEYGAPYENAVTQSLWGNGSWQSISASLTLSHSERLNVFLYSPIGQVIYDDVQVEEISSYLLTVTKAGTGTGTVTGSGIDCGTDCTEMYLEGTVLNLKATPDADSEFQGWLVNGQAVTGAIPVNEVVNVTAAFNKK